MATIRPYCYGVQVIAQSEDRRYRILVAALTLIASQGLGAVTIRTVASLAGTSVGLVQHYFPSKQLLIQGAAQFVIDQAESQFFADDGCEDARTQLRALLAHSISTAARARQETSIFYSLVVAAVTDPAVSAILAEAKSGTVTLLESLLASAAPELADPRSLAVNLMALSDGLTLQVMIGQTSPETAVATVDAALAQHGLGDAPPPPTGRAG